MKVYFSQPSATRNLFEKRFLDFQKLLINRSQLGTKKLYYPVLLVLPALMVLTAVWLNHARGPFWLGSNLDPEYVYLLNAANLASLKGVGHIDHPGTPVQILGAVTIRVVHFFSPSPGTDWHADLLLRPEFYLNAIHAVLVTLNILMLLALGFASYHFTGKLWLALWLQLAPFFSTTLLQFGFTRVTPEPFLFFSSLAMVLMIIVRTFSPLQIILPSATRNPFYKRGSWTSPKFLLEGFITLIKSFWKSRNLFSKRFLAAGGIISGFGIANKITFFPMMIIPLILFPRLKNKLLYLAATAFGFVIFTLPIIRMYPRFFAWMSNLLTHSGQYGSGPSSVISSGKLIHNIQFLLSGNPFFSVVLLLALVTISASLLIPSWRKISRSGVYFKVLVAVTAAQVLGLLAVSKHSALHYLLPVLNLSGITLALVCFHLKPILLPQGMTPRVSAAAAAVLLGFLIVLFPLGKIKNTAALLSKLKQGSLAIYQVVNDNYHDYAKIYYYRSSSPEFALKFGNDLSRSYHSEILDKLYKDVYFYDIWAKRFTGFDYNRAISFESLRAKYGDKIIFQGSRGLKIPGIDLIKVSPKDFYEGIYIIDSASGGSGPF